MEPAVEGPLAHEASRNEEAERARAVRRIMVGP